MKRRSLIICMLCCVLSIGAEEPSHFQFSSFSLEDIIGDIYNYVTEFSEVDFEQLQTDLYALHESPIDLNHTSDEELAQLYFLSPKQIDAILAYADRHPFESLYELRMIPCLEEYEIRDLLPFVKITKVSSENPNNIMYAREVFAHAKHEIITRVDARKLERFEGDPVYVQTRYRFDYQRRVMFGAQLRRPPGGDAGSLQYGAWLQLRDIGRLHTLVAGNFQASFGQGLVLAPVFHTGKSMYVQSAGQQTNGLRYYSSADGQGLHGAGTTLRWEWNKHNRLDVSALYSMRRANDSIWHHLVGANLTMRHKLFELQLTAVENIWSDSIHPYRDAKYNRHYFRGYNQAVLGASARYNHGWFDAFAEVATAQNHKSPITNNKSPITNDQWGIGLIAGSRFYPASGISLIALYRYYSPYFDNALGYAFSETSRLGDENGGYLGFDITRLARWRFSGYGDVFRFCGPKYGIPQAPSLGFDALSDIQYIRPAWRIDLRLRAKRKGEQDTYSTRFQFDITEGAWSFRTTADANLVYKSPITNYQSQMTYGVSLAQDFACNLQQSALNYPLSLRFRLQVFDAREWVNRIYLYEHDVLYAFSIPATYGLGGRAYLCLKWQIIPQLALYFRVSETVKKVPLTPVSATTSPLTTQTDLHLLLRAKL